MNKKKILYLDMDGVIADFDAGIKSFAPNLHTSDQLNNYEITEKLITDLCIANPDIFHTLPPIEGAIESVKELFSLFEVYFLSTPMWELPQSFTGKRIWVDTHFGVDAQKRLILSHRKDLNIGHYLVDDRLRNGVSEFTGEHIHFGTDKFPDWKVTMEYLRKAV